MDRHVVTEENCTDLTPEPDYLVGKRIELLMLQDGTKLSAELRSMEEGDQDIPPLKMTGTASGSSFRLSGTISRSKSGSEGGVSFSASARADIVLSGEVEGDSISGTMKLHVKLTVSVSGYGSRSEECHVSTEFSGTRVAKPAPVNGSDVLTPDAFGGPDSEDLADVSSPEQDSGGQMGSSSGALVEGRRPDFLEPLRIHGVVVMPLVGVFTEP